MTIRSLAEVSARLEEAVAGLPGEPADAAELAERLEMVGIQVIDSEFHQYRPGELAEYVGAYIYVRQLQLRLIPFPDPREE